MSTDAKTTVNELKIRTPDDFHLHVRDGDMLPVLVSAAAAQFNRAIIMPNLVPPVVNTEQALAYRERILTALKESKSEHDFTPLMTLYLTDVTSPAEIEKAKASGHIYAVKLYPAGATTNSEHGVTDLTKTYPALEKMSEIGMPLLIHGEVTDAQVDIFDREAEFLERTMKPLVERFTKLKIVMEHVTTKAAVEFVQSAPANVSATITAHHLLYNRNQIFAGGVCPHYYCLPVLKTETDRKALVEAAVSGTGKFFAGTDSAPHLTPRKECFRGCAGCYTSHTAIELYAEAFDKVGALDKLEGFTSIFGARFYGLPLNEGTVTLRREKVAVPAKIQLGASGEVVPVRAGEFVEWTAQRSK